MKFAERGVRECQTEIITLPFVSCSIMGQRCVFARDAYVWSFSQSSMVCNIVDV